MDTGINMKNKKIIITALFAAVLLNAALLSLASAQEDNPTLIAPAPDASTNSEELTPSLIANSTATPDNIYTIQEDNSTDIGYVPENAEPNLIATQTDSSDSELVMVAIGASIGFVVVAVGVSVVFYRKKHHA
jgi:hypothetical protein